VDLFGYKTVRLFNSPISHSNAPQIDTLQGTTPVPGGYRFPLHQNVVQVRGSCCIEKVRKNLQLKRSLKEVNKCVHLVNNKFATSLQKIFRKERHFDLSEKWIRTTEGTPRKVFQNLLSSTGQNSNNFNNTMDLRS
jgi:hypothetical protein